MDDGHVDGMMIEQLIEELEREGAPFEDLERLRDLRARRQRLTRTQNALAKFDMFVAFTQRTMSEHNVTRREDLPLDAQNRIRELYVALGGPETRPTNIDAVEVLQHLVDEYFRITSTRAN